MNRWVTAIVILSVLIVFVGWLGAKLGRDVDLMRARLDRST